ncbi:MAG: kynureninase, partial [Bacteroidetes bacterium]|nr:kynureninase [Bacteroidota bacterium]
MYIKTNIMAPGPGFTTGKEFASGMDAKDPLKKYRDHFFIPKTAGGKEYIYFCGNSLGLQPKGAMKEVDEVMRDWSHLAVEGHFHAAKPWYSFDDILSPLMARVVGAKPAEVALMNSLTVNLHLMLVSFYRPSGKRTKIMMEYSPFPSDLYAVKSHLKMHGYDPEKHLIGIKPDGNEHIVSAEKIEREIEKNGDEVALVLFGGVNYLTGQTYDISRITGAAHKKGCIAGFDLAHSAGNVPLQLHDWDVDFAVWCTYKYLNGGPGSIGGCFVH